MKVNAKLPIPMQLIGVTAALIFCTSTVGLIGFAGALAANWQVLDQMPRTWSGFYYPFVTSVGLYSALAIVSAAVFASLFFARRAVLVRVSLAYLAVLLLALMWRLYDVFPGGGLGGLRLASPRVYLRLGVCVLYAAWLLGLAVALLPNYSLKRTAANRLGVD